MIRHHLDNAATSFPKPPEVLRAVEAALRSPGNPRRGSGEAAREAAASLEGARREVAELVGAPPERLAFTLNATDALNMAIASLAPPGSRVVVSELEHGAVTRPLRRRERDGLVTLVRVAPDATGLLAPAAVAEAARGASLVAVTMASNVTGDAQPIEAIAEALPGGATLLVDAAQGAGSLPLDAGALGPRAVACLTGHKALLGPMGCGAIVVGEDVALAPWREGGTGDGGLDHPGGMPERLEAGTLPLPAILGLLAGVRWWRREGVDRVRERERELLARMVDALRSAGAELPAWREGPRAPLVSFRLPGLLPEEAAHVLETEHGVTVRAGLHCAPAAHALLGSWPEGLLRASVGPTTTADDADAFCDAVRDLAR